MGGGMCPADIGSLVAALVLFLIWFIPHILWQIW